MSEPTPKTIESLYAKVDELMASLRRRPATRDDEADDIDPSDKRSMAGRLSIVTSQRRAAEEAAAEAVRLAGEMRAAHAAEIAALKADAAKSVTDGVRRVEQGYALRAAMVEPDDDGVQTAHRLYDAIPENKRPDNIVEWWKTLTPEAAPKTLRAYLAAPVVEQQQTATPGRQPPRVDVGKGKATEPDPSTMDAAQYDAWISGLANKRASDQMGG